MAWKICIDKPFMNCEHIFPIQQKYISTIIEGLKKNQNVKKVIIFGSSVTSSCHPDSDIDIYLELDKNEKTNIPLIYKPYDYWNNFSADERLKKEIYGKGVVVYERGNVS